MATISSLDNDLDLSTLDSINFDEIDIDQEQSQTPTKKQRADEESLDLSTLDNLFPEKIQPLSSPPSKITSKFGKRKDPFGLGVKFHNGVDIPIALNTPINSLGKGTVIEVGDSGKKDYGKFVKVDYGGGLVLTYGHLNKAAVEAGDRITSEAVIGLSGSTGRSKGPHVHIKAELNGKPVNPENYFGSIHDVAIGALTTDDVVNEAKLDLSVLDNLDESAVKVEEDKEELDLSPVDQIGEFNIKDLKPLEEKPFVDRRSVAEKIAAGGAALHQPNITGANPNQLVGDRITTIIPVKGVNKPDINTVTDYWLGAISPSYSQINQEYRAQTGRNLIQFTGDVEYTGDNKYKLSARMTKGATDLINAYIDGRSKGGPQAGWEAAYLKSQQIKREEQNVKEQVEAARKENVDLMAQRHPYIKAAFNILSPATMIDSDAVKTGLANTAIADAQLVHNLRMLPEALYTLYRYGGDSQQYQDLIERDREIQNNLYSYQREIKQPETISESIGAGVITGIASFPKYATVGRLGLGALPTLAYVENLHRGNIEGAKAALPMALMVGATHGLDSFFSKGTSLYVTKEKNGISYIERVEVGRGLGSAAPFTRFREARQYIDEWNNITEPGTSLLKNEIRDAFFSNEAVSIASISPITRQLIMRGTNAFQNLGTTALTGGDLEESAASFVVGLTFPVGKYRAGRFDEGRFGLIPYVPSKETINQPPLLGQKKVLIPVTKGGEILESDRRTLSTDPLASELEKGFQARSEGQTLYLNLDTAALNLLDLRRAVKEGKLGGGSVKGALNRLMAVNQAISILDKQIPKEIQKYFEDNEAIIRAGMRSNWEAVRAKEEYLGARKLTDEPVNPDQVKENPDVNIKESPIQRLNNVIQRVGNIKENPIAVAEAAKEVFGNTGESNRWVTPDRALFAFDRLINTTSKGGVKLRSGLDLAAIGKDLVEGSKAIWDLTQISAFYLEDFYHRKVEPNVNELANKFRIALGDIVKNFTDEDFQKLFVEGKRYLDSNVADPFFSRMKQDAVEKLPNRMTVEQARNVLSQHKDEFEWTTGLKEFLDERSKKAYSDQKINKKELIDIIQKGQVRVEESIADDVYKQSLIKQRQEVDKELRKLEVVSDDPPYYTVVTDKSKYDALYNTREFLDKELLTNTQSTKYSLEAYPHEKLELPGAKNSKEVKLISPIVARYYDPIKEEFVVGRTGNKAYQSAHWDEPNVVAHYRSNDRITTDNQRVYFGEEFQSDWAHDIKEYGPKVSFAEAREYAKNNVEEFIEYGKTFYRIKPRGNETIVGNVARSKQEAIDNFVTVKGEGGTEKMPFMGHSWKELVLKRFLRDAAIAKDENGNYKYDGIGWTTARQQLERYGGILEGKEFKWQKNSDGTYTFDLRNSPDNAAPPFEWLQPHELRNISLERFAELTTKEAADFVRQQETDNTTKAKEKYGENYKNYPSALREIYSGQFSLSETVELRSKEGTYADYDVAYKNIVSKIGKRFGAKYSEKEIHAGLAESRTAITDRYGIIEAENNGQYIYNGNDNLLSYSEARKALEEGADLYVIEKNDNLQKIHYLEITPSMRSSLEKEGLPLYGTGGSEALKYSEAGARNRIVTADAFNSAREDLITKLSQPENKGITLNSGLNPDAFIDQVKLLHSGIKDLQEFTNSLVERYGEPIRQFAEDFYFAIKQQANDFKEKLSIPIENWSDNLKKNEDSAAWKIREFVKSEEGALKLPKFLRKDQIPELKDYLTDKEKHQVPIGFDYRAWLRGVALSQISTEFGKVYDTMRTLQRVVSAYETNSTNLLMQAKKVIKTKLDANVAEALYQGNEWIDPATGEHKGKVWSDAELTANFGLNSQQIDAYRNMRAAIDNVLNLRLEGKLYAVREKATKLTAKLATVVPGSPEELAINTQLLDLADAQAKMIKYYDDLKNSGYVTLQRKGNIAAFIEDPSYPVGDPNRKIYNQFQSRNQAVKWIEKQKAALGIPKNTLAGSMYDIRSLRDIVLKEQLTPSQFEDLVDRSGAHTNDAEIEKLRAEVYSKFPSFTYQLKREFVRGYDRDLQTAINSTVDQLELYASSFYSKVGKEEGLKALEATGIEKTDPNLYRLTNSYIADETQAAELNWLSKAAITARRGTYLFQLGFDVNQLWMNAVAQPITQTYQYFYRIQDPSGSGKQLTGLEPEHYFIKAGKETLNWRLGKSSTEFNDIVKRLVDERVLSPEFTKTFIESQTGTGKSTKIEHWASVFMREGEKQTRLHTAAEGYFVGKEKFGLSGDELINFITKAVDATQSNPTRGENPFVIRQLGEGGKLFYQFGAFNQMWWENLALGVKQSKGITRKSLFLAREMAPLAIMGGISALPLSMFAGAMYTLTTGRDPKKDWDKFLGDDTLIEQLARYGISTSAAISRKISPQVPVIDPLIQTSTSPTIDSLGDTLSEHIPFFATAEQLRRGVAQVAGGDYFKGIINLSPRAIKGPLKMVQTSNKGYKVGGETALSRRRITPIQKAGQFFNVSPTPVVEKYDRERSKRLKKVHKKLKRITR